MILSGTFTRPKFNVKYVIWQRTELSSLHSLYYVEYSVKNASTWHIWYDTILLVLKISANPVLPIQQPSNGHFMRSYRILASVQLGTYIVRVYPPNAIKKRCFRTGVFFIFEKTHIYIEPYHSKYTLIGVHQRVQYIAKGEPKKKDHRGDYALLYDALKYRTFSLSPSRYFSLFASQLLIRIPERAQGVIYRPLLILKNFNTIPTLWKYKVLLNFPT